MPDTAPARGVLYGVLALLAWFGTQAPAPTPPFELTQRGEGCLLTSVPGRACACRDWPAPLRRVMGIALPLNRASAEDLELLPSIGPARAQAIVDERKRGGRFRTVDDLVRVSGIAGRRAAQLRPFLFVGANDPACFPIDGEGFQGRL